MMISSLLRLRLGPTSAASSDLHRSGTISIRRSRSEKLASLKAKAKSESESVRKPLSRGGSKLMIEREGFKNQQMEETLVAKLGENPIVTVKRNSLPFRNPPVIPRLFDR